MAAFIPPSEPLSDGRVSLRPLTRVVEKDIDAVASSMGDIDLASWLERRTGDERADARTLLAECADGWVRGTHVTFGVFEDGGVLAMVAAMVTGDPEVAELGIWVRRDARRHGLGAAAVKLLSGWCFSSGIERVWIEIDPTNDASHALARSTGFVHEGVLRSHCRDRRTNERHDCVVYSLLPSDPSTE